ncbi:hypothetical protein [Rhodanobacter sp. B04]|uniref:hypothetical protein n=1 Tax=Rhodanobacter sp. B04 TaxID=1945860 RepID=UPI0011155D49|nr:hypothetical protein [Rhodanobacter sp. B04]
MSTELFAAERTWFAVAPDGTEHDAVLRIGVPTHAPGGEWRAVVSLRPMESRSHPIAGVDAWQATCLAIHFAATRVGHFAEDGWQFYWERGGKPASPEGLAIVPKSL